jgi:hypothetical protein
LIPDSSLVETDKHIEIVSSSLSNYIFKNNFFKNILTLKYRDFNILYNKIITESRAVHLIVENDKVIAIMILKHKHSSVKVCTLLVHFEYRNRGLGKYLFSLIDHNIYIYLF